VAGVNDKPKYAWLQGIDRSRNIAGLTFGRLTVIERAGVSKNRFALWKCLCVCGSQRILSTATLTTGQTKSCGCMRREQTTTHGLSRTPIHSVWSAMMARCYNPESNRYESYHGRGITVCVRWHNIELFLQDMGEPPAHGLSIERIDNEGNYEPGNCRWATQKEQARNRRTTLWIEYQGKTKSLAEWAEEIGFNYKQVWKRIRCCGWSVDRAFEST
jgi:hypothetical protein